jgi:hypothetical protein
MKAEQAPIEDQAVIYPFLAFSTFVVVLLVETILAYVCVLLLIRLGRKWVENWRELVRLMGLDGSERLRRRLTHREPEALACFMAKEAADLEDPTGAWPVLINAACIRAAGTAIQGDTDLGPVGVALGGERPQLLRRVGVLHVDGEDR